MDVLYFAQKAFVVHEDKVLVIQKSVQDPDHPGKWEVPGGRMTFGENIDAHIKREVKEEVGIEIEPGEPFHIWQWMLLRHGERMQVIAVARMCSPVTFNISTTGQVEGDFISGIKWVPIKDLSTYDWIPNMVPVIDAFLNRVLK